MQADPKNPEENLNLKPKNPNPKKEKLGKQEEDDVKHKKEHPVSANLYC